MTTQQTLQDIHEHMKSVAQLWVSGLITDKEIASNFTTRLAEINDTTDSNPLDCIDPATGLRYI